MVSAIHELAAMSVSRARAWFAGLKLLAKEKPVARPIVQEVEQPARSFWKRWASNT